MVRYVISKIRSFLNDSSFNINISNHFIYISNYEKLVTIQDSSLLISFSSFNLEVKGADFKLVRMVDKELYISGIVKEMKIHEPL